MPRSRSPGPRRTRAPRAKSATSALATGAAAASILAEHVNLSRFRQRPWTPLTVALTLFHPLLLLRTIAHWLSVRPARGALLAGLAAVLVRGGVFSGVMSALVVPPPALLVLLLVLLSMSTEKVAPLIVEPKSEDDANADKRELLTMFS